MSDIQELLDRLEARDAWTLIKELSFARTRKKQGEAIEVPLATFHLRNGRDVSGWVLDLREGNRGAWSLLLQVPSHGSGPAQDVTYLDPQAVEAVTVQDAPRSIEVLSFGAIERTDDAPTRLALKRRVEELNGELTRAIGGPVAIEIDWDAIPGEDAHMLSLSRAVDAMVGAVQEIASATDASELRGRLSVIRFEHAQASGVATVDGALVISAALDKGRLGRLDRAALKQAIEAAL